jgi:multimeric flavodoxin WrbA
MNLENVWHRWQCAKAQICRIKDEIHDLLDDTRSADGIVIGSPVYFMDISAQTKCFFERLNYPGPSAKKIPSTFIYTMNANEEQFEQFQIDKVLGTTRFYMKNNFGVEPDAVYSFNTFQYNDRENLSEHFRRNVQAKLANREIQFPKDKENAYQAGIKMVERIREFAHPLQVHTTYSCDTIQNI